jgi:pyruvate,orthophosphate dikinase
MPGMMDTILNIGLTMPVLAARTQDPGEAAFWYDCRFHLIWLFASSVHAGLAMPRLATAIKAWYRHRSEIHRLDWTATILDHALELYREYTGEDFPEDPLIQLSMAVAAVFRSWNSLRAVEYRAINHIPDHLGTGVTIQRMVFGNRDERSASGVFFTRDPESGRPDFGEMVVRGQGEEVVSGQHSPLDIHHMASLAPEAWRQLLELGHGLERRHHLAQDIEFTLESGRLWILQSRAARLTTRGRLLSLIDMVDEGLIGVEAALAELSAEALEDLDSTTFAQRDIEQAELQGLVLAHGLGVFHGVAVGRAAFSLEGIRRLQSSEPGCRCILVKEDTKPEDIEAMYESSGCATRVGGPTSHAAINARVIGRPCVVNCTTLTIVKDAFDRISEIRVGDQVLREGDWVSLDGNRALFIRGQLKIQSPESDAQSRQARQRFLAWHSERENRRAAEED